MSSNKDFRPIVEELRVQGWGLTQTARGHWKALPPELGQAIVHFSESADPRAFKNTIQDLKRSGFSWPPLAKEKRESSAPVWDAYMEKAAEPAAEQPTPPRETQEQQMDRLWRELKEAKGYAALSEEHAAEKQRALAAAEAACAEAEQERLQAHQRLRVAKADFDRAFESSSAA